METQEYTLTQQDLRWIRFFKVNIAKCAKETDHPKITLGLMASLLIGILYSDSRQAEDFGVALSGASDIIAEIEALLQEGQISEAFELLQQQIVQYDESPKQ